MKPLCILFQQSLNAVCFPRAWKQTVVLPLYKRQGNRDQASSYRPLSLCSNIGKMLEKIISAQFISSLSVKKCLHGAQHGFRAGRSTLTNLLTFDKLISNVVSLGHPYDVVSVDFQKAFDKVPHRCVIEALAQLGLGGKTLGLFFSFLEGRTQRSKLADVCPM